MSLLSYLLIHEFSTGLNLTSIRDPTLSFMPYGVPLPPYSFFDVESTIIAPPRGLYSKARE